MYFMVSILFLSEKSYERYIYNINRHFQGIRWTSRYNIMHLVHKFQILTSSTLTKFQLSALSLQTFCESKSVY